MKKIILFTLMLILTGCVNNQTDNNNNIQQNIENEVVEETNNMEKTNNEEITKSFINQPIEGYKDLVSKFNKAIIKTNFGDIEVKFYTKESPITVNNFFNLAEMGFYNNTKFHRVIQDFMVQGGDPNSKDDNWENDGMGGPNYKFNDEFNEKKLVKGSFAMANSGQNTNGSQFFIVTKEATPWLDGMHTNFGYVTNGIEIIEKIDGVKTNENDHPLDDIIIENIELK